jgi:hypothetical protein
MQKIKFIILFSKFTVKDNSVKAIIPFLLATILFAATITPLYAQLSPARDLTGTWRSGVSGVYYSMDPSDPTLRMDDITATFQMDITQQGSQIQIVFYTYSTSWRTDPAYYNEWGMNGVPPVNGGDILFKGTVSGASFTADEYPASSSTKEHLSGTFTTDIISATLTGLLETSDTNGIIVIRSGSSATVPPIATVAPTATPTPPPVLPTSTNLASVSEIQGSTWFAATGAPVTLQSPIEAGAEVQTGNDAIIGFNYPDNGGTVYLGANSVAGWVYLESQTDLITGNISYIVVPPLTGSYSFSEGIEPEEFGQAGISIAAEVAVGFGIMFVTGVPITLGGAVVVEGTLLLGTGIAYIHEQLSPQEGTFDVRPIQVPQGLLIGAGTDYVVEVFNGSTTIQVMEGSVIFVDQYTNNSITVGANQMLTLPAGVQTGFSQQDLQAKVSNFDASSINQWWITAPIATPIIPTVTPTSPSITLAPTNALNNNSNFLSQPMFLALFLVIIIVIVAVLSAVIKQKHTRQPGESNRKSRKQKITTSVYETPKTNLQTTETANTSSVKPETKQPTATFCPNCGNQILKTEGSCPFCNSDLSQWYQNTKK